MMIFQNQFRHPSPVMYSFGLKFCEDNPPQFLIVINWPQHIINQYIKLMQTT